MATLSLGSGLVNKITKKVFSDNYYYFANTSGYTDFSTATYMDATKIGMGGYGGTQTNSYNGNSLYGTGLSARPSLFSLMKGVVPSAIGDVSSGQRASDIIVTFTGPAPNSDLNSGKFINTNGDTALTYSGGSVAPNDFIIVVDGKTATWSALNLSFLPRYPVASGTPTWFWFRTNLLQHNIIGTVGATGSGSDLELQTYAYIDATKEYTLYNATMATFEMTQEINY
jgi:hypothetical protein